MEAADPIEQFRSWYEEALGAGIDKPHAMVLSTVGRDGKPASRVVLLSSFDRDGLVFHTNYESRKGHDIAHLPWAALLFWWDPLGYQVRIEGPVEKTSARDSDKYFASRPRGSQLSAWASDQSRPVADRDALEERTQKLERDYEGRSVPRPPYWGGYRLVPHVIEFWKERPNRLHDRIRYERTAEGGWRRVRLAP